MKTSRSDVRRIMSKAVKSQASRCRWMGADTIARQFLQAIGFKGGVIV